MRTRIELAGAVKTRATAIVGPSWYSGEVDETPPTISSQDLRVLPYGVIHTGAGAGDDERLGGDRGGLAWGFQINAVAGIEDHLNRLVDDILTAFEGWRPFPDTGRCWQPLGLEVGPPRPDISKTPTRFWLPLLFTIHA